MESIVKYIQDNGECPYQYILSCWIIKDNKVFKMATTSVLCPLEWLATAAVLMNSMFACIKFRMAALHVVCGSTEQVTI